jgi:DNA polymerase-2
MPTLRGDTKGSKKRYAGKNQAGHLIFKGLEAARGDWTPLAKEFQTELYTRIFADQSVEDFIVKQVELLKKGKLDQKLTYRKRLGQSLEKYQRNVPPHVKAVMNFQLLEPNFKISRGDWVDYIITTKGPVLLAQKQFEKSLQLDYSHYIYKQLKPIVEAFESHLALNFEKLIDEQKRLF